MALSPTAQRVQDLLVKRGFASRVVEFVESTRTSQEAADRAGCELGQITKSMIFKGKSSGKAILVLTSGANRVDERRLSDLVGETVTRPDAEFVRRTTGFSIGGVPPLGHAEPLETYLDEDLMLYKTIWAAAGTANSIFELTPQQLEQMTGAKVVRVK